MVNLTYTHTKQLQQLNNITTMIKLGGLVSLKPINEADYVHVGYGKYKEKSKKDVEGAPLFKKDDSGKYSPIGGDDKGGEAKPTGQAVQGADMFKHDKSVKQPKEEPKQEPTKSSSDTAEVANKLKNRKTKNGEELDIDVTPNGSLIIGVEHGKRKKSNKETIEQIKKLPNRKNKTIHNKTLNFA